VFTKCEIKLSDNEPLCEGLPGQKPGKPLMPNSIVGSKVLDGPTDSTAPWTIKSFPNELRAMVVEAARAEGLTVAMWLERVIRQAVGEAVQENRGVNRSDLAELRELVAMATTLTPPGKDLPVAREARRAVRERLIAMRVSRRPRPE
jgi:hypothetical protein